MRMVSFATGLALAGLSAGVAHGQQNDPKLAAFKAKLNAASARFRSAQADVERDAYTALIKETDKQQGKSYFLRDGAGATEMGLLADGPNGKPERIAQFKNGTLEDYNVGIKCFNSYQASGKVDAFLTLGFGGSYTDLERAWEITDKGSETMGGVKVEKLDLVPKDAGVRNNVTHVELWLDPERDVSLKQVFYSPSGDTSTAIYSNIRLNGKVDTKEFAFKGGPCSK